MTQDQIIEQLLKWMQDFVEVPHPGLGNWSPCPYARQARVNNRIEFVESRANELVNAVEQNLHILDTKDVMIVWFDHHDVDPAALSESVRLHNQLLMPRDYVILEDHPGAPEYVNGVQMNFGMCGLLLVQRLSKLNTASKQLKAQGYYDSWNPEALDEVVNWRIK